MAGPSDILNLVSEKVTVSCAGTTETIQGVTYSLRKVKLTFLDKGVVRAVLLFSKEEVYLEVTTEGKLTSEWKSAAYREAKIFKGSVKVLDRVNETLSELQDKGVMPVSFSLPQGVVLNSLFECRAIETFFKYFFILCPGLSKEL